MDIEVTIYNLDHIGLEINPVRHLPYGIDYFTILEVIIETMLIWLIWGEIPLSLSSLTRRHNQLFNYLLLPWGFPKNI